MGGDKIVLLDGAGSGSRTSAATDGWMSMLPGLFANMFNKQTDPNLIAALMNGRSNQDNFGGSGAWFMWIIILFWLQRGGLFGGFGNGFGGGFGGGMPFMGGLPNQLNNDFGRELLMQAISGNRSAIDQIASALNCTTTQLQNAICQVQGAIDKVAGQVGMSSQAVINAVQQQGCEIGNQISSCCCNLSSLINQSTCNLQSQINQSTNTLQNQISQATCNTQNMITQQGFDNQLRTLEQTNTLQNNLNNGFSNNREVSTNQFNILSAKIDAQTQLINQQFCDLEKRNMQETINALREEKQTLAFQASQQAQNKTLIDALKPCPIPAYITCDPYTGRDGLGFYRNGWNNGGFSGNSCGCNSGGCCNNANV